MKEPGGPQKERVGEDVEQVDVDKLKEMVHVKDEDIAKLDKYVVQQERGEARS